MSVDAIAWALKARGLSPRAKLVLIAIADACDVEGVGYPSRKRLAEGADCSRDTVDRCVREIVDAEMMTVEKRFDPSRNDQTSNLYRLAMTPAAEMRPPVLDDDVDAAPPSRKPAPQPHPDAATPAARIAATPAASDAAPIEHPVERQLNVTPSLRSGGARAKRTVRRLATEDVLPAEPTPSMLAFASEHGFVNGRTEALFGAWRDHHISKATPIADADASFRTWVRNEIKFNGRPSHVASPAGGQPRLFGVAAQNAAFNERSNRGALAALRGFGEVVEGGPEVPAAGGPDEGFPERRRLGGA